MIDTKEKIIEMITLQLEIMDDETFLDKLQTAMELYCTKLQILEAYKDAINSALYEKENMVFSPTSDDELIALLKCLIG